MKAWLKAVALCCFSAQAWAVDIALEKIEVATGLAAIERGVEAMMNDCHSCHSMKYIKYRDLAGLGIGKQKLDAWRGDQPMDAPLLAQIAESDAVQAYGKAPPDLSLMVQARDGGANYVYSYLVGYYVTPEGMPGNRVYPVTRMPDVLGIAGATAQRGEIQGRARDIVSFLSWAADPHQAERIRLGYYVITYLLVLTTLLYVVKRQIWARLNRMT